MFFYRRHVDFLRFHQSAISERDKLTVYISNYTLTCYGFKLGDWLRRQFLFLRIIHNRGCQRMLAKRIQAGGIVQYVGLSKATGGYDTLHLRFTFSEGAGLVD